MRASRWRLIVGLRCVALIVLGGTLSVAHGHDDGITHADCGLCATAHVTVQVASTLTLGPVTQVFTRVDTSLPEIRPRTLFRSELFTRPPPAGAYLNS
jgi:hypothetical protein